MRQKSLTRHSRARAWRNGAIALALAGTGLGTAFATVGIGKGSAPDAERALTKTIMHQRIAQGLPAQPPPPAGAPEPAQRALTADQILAAVASYETEMKDLISQVEDMQKKAYAAKDIIRLNYLTSKHEEMKLIESMVQPVIDSIRLVNNDLFIMQAKLSTIRQGLDQLRKAAADAAAAQGDGMDMGVSAVDPKNVGAGAHENDGVADLAPVGTPSPTEFPRPSNASPYK